MVAGITFLNWPEIKCMQFFFYFYARILLMAAKSFKEEGGARLAETILQRGAAGGSCV